MNKKKPSAAGNFFRKIYHGLVYLIVTCLVGATFFCLAMLVMYRGPSPTARDLFVNTVMETHFGQFLAKTFFSDEEIAAIRAKNAVETVNDITNQNAVNVSGKASDKIDIIDINGPTFLGKMMIVYDPTRVHLAVLEDFTPEGYGMKIEDLIESNGGIAGMNASGFVDTGGNGKGGMPIGLIIKDGKILNGKAEMEYCVIGLDAKSRLVVGNMSAQEALDRGVVEAVSFGPLFVVNGVAADVKGTGGGLNPRTVIGQREDGAILMLLIDGRQPQSVGATFKDCIDIMLEYGAVNAANLDGGSSSVMVYGGEVINRVVSMQGSRRIPTAFMVTK